MARRRGEWSRGERAVSRILKRATQFTHALPVPLAARMGRRLGRTLWPLAPSRRRIALENLTMVFGDHLSPRRKTQIAFESFVRLFQDALVLLKASSMATQQVDKIVTIVNRNHLDDTIRDGRGAILVSGHLSNFYMVLGYLGRLKYAITALVRPLAIRPAQRVLVETAAASGLPLVDQGKGRLALTRHLEQGGITWFSLDQNARHGVLVKFLGRPATTYAGPVRLARRIGIPIIPAFVRQDGPYSYELNLHPPIRLPTTKPTDEEVVADLSRLMTILEDEVKRHPAAWLWGHRRWRHGDRMTNSMP